MPVAEKQFGPLALDDEGIERRQDMHQLRSPIACSLQRLTCGPMLLLAGAFERDRHHRASAYPGFDQPPDRRLARRIEMANRIQADDALRAQGAIEPIGMGFPHRGRLRRLVRRHLPAEMPRHQFIGLEHAVAFADGEEALVECQLQRALRRLAAGPRMLLVNQHVVIDVADRQRAVAPDQPHHLAQIRRADRTQPFVAFAPVTLHRRHEKAQVFRRHIRQGVGPVFEHAFVDALGLMQIRAPIAGDSGPEYMVMAALDDVDGVDLHIAQMFHRRGRRSRPLTERRRHVEPLRAQPDVPGFGFGQADGFGGAGHRAAM